MRLNLFIVRPATYFHLQLRKLRLIGEEETLGSSSRTKAADIADHTKLPVRAKMLCFD
jgi:hypothetical protein